MTITYSNPRLAATIEDWPMGGSKRGKAIFAVETHPKKGQRATRTTTGKPKCGVYSPKVRILDGDDGKTYIGSLTMYGHVSIMHGNLQFQAESVHDHDPRYAAIVALFAE